MSLSASLKKKFEERIGLTIDELNDPTLLAENKNKIQNNYGRGYVHFGRSVNPHQKDKENLKILSNW